MKFDTTTIVPTITDRVIIIIQLGAKASINCQWWCKSLLVELDQQMDYRHHRIAHAFDFEHVFNGGMRGQFYIYWWTYFEAFVTLAKFWVYVWYFIRHDQRSIKIWRWSKFNFFHYKILLNLTIFSYYGKNELLKVLIGTDKYNISHPFSWMRWNGLIILNFGKFYIEKDILIIIPRRNFFLYQSLFHQIRLIRSYM